MKILDQLVGNFINISVPGMEGAFCSLHTTLLAIVDEVFNEVLIIFDIFQSNV